MTPPHDVIVVGAGPAGEVVAGRLAARGHAVAIIEQDLVGGECSFYACMPSKALLRPAQALAEARRIPGAAEAVTGDLDAGAVLARRDEVVHGLDDSAQLPWLQSNGVTLVRGAGRLDGERRVRVGDELHEARLAVVLAVGSRAALPPIPGLADARPWTNREVTTADRVPGRLIVLGGGVVGVEMADAYASLGASVVVIEAQARLVGHEESFVSDQLREALVARGIDVRVGVRAEAVARRADGIEVTLSDGPGVRGDELLVAVGRRPRTDELGLETVGLKPGGYVEVDDQLRVPGRPWLYAIGDVNGRALLTHAGKYQAHVVSEAIDGRPARLGAGAGSPAAGVTNGSLLATRGAGTPRVIFTELQVAAVGMTLQAALDAGIEARAYDVPTSATAGASFHGRDTPGSSRIVVDERRGVLVGATFAGFEVAEWLQAATIALAGEVPVVRLWDTIAPFPTRSEVWLRLLEEREAQLASGVTAAG
ncbi:MAG: dihydrolipoyl dehydrogenase family protein [Solirubrobacteraceae bacterium]